jgi:ABC-type transporter Mla MlaB component
MSDDELNINVHNLVLSGPVTLYESSEVRESLLSAVAEGKDLRIDLEMTGPWDLAGLQLLVSVVAAGRKLGQSVRFVQVPGVCREIAERSGLAAWLGDATDSFL